MAKALATEREHVKRLQTLEATLQSALAAERYEVKLRDETISLGKQVVCELKQQLAAEREKSEKLGWLLLEAQKSLAAERQRRKQQGKAYERLKSEHQKQLDKLLKATELVTEQLLSAQAAIEKHNQAVEDWKDEAAFKIEVDLSLLRKHDAEVRLPLVNVLKGIRIALEVSGGFERTIKNIDAALATIKDL